jgi:DNA-binding NarL/FixJ family response regulator
MAITQANPVRVLLVDKDPFQLAMLTASLRLHGENIVGEASNLSLAENLFRSLQPELVLIDLQPPAEEGILFLQKVRKVNPKVGIVIMTSCPDLRLMGLQERDIPRGIKIILKAAVSDLTLITTALSASIEAAEMSSAISWVGTQPLTQENSQITAISELTDVQIETLRLVAQGLSNSEIARVRFVSEKSVEQIVARIAQQLRISPERGRNLRIILTSEYFKWVGAPHY